jgi:hypothetical protein
MKLVELGAALTSDAAGGAIFGDPDLKVHLARARAQS